MAKERKGSRIWRRWAGSEGFSPDNVRYTQCEYGRVEEVLFLEEAGARVRLVDTATEVQVQVKV